MTRLFLPGVIVVASLVLALWGLGNAFFWDDEAYTAIMARNWLATGSLTGWDGRNLLAYRNGTLLDENLRGRNPPLEYYVAAASFRCLGENTAAGRLPFVLVGIASLVLFGRILARECPHDEALRGYSLAALGLSVPFLLYIRQCHYYSLSLFFTLLTYHAYRRMIERATWPSAILLAFAAIGTFYSHYLLSVAFLTSLLLFHLGFHRHSWQRSDWLKVLSAVFLFSVATIPHAVAHRIWHRPDFLPSDPWYWRKPLLFWWNLRDVNLGGFFPWTFAIAAVIWFGRHRREPVAKLGIRFLAIAVVYAAVLGWLSPQPTDNPGNASADVRYLVPILGFLAGASGALLALVDRRSRGIALAALVLLLGTNLFFLTPSRARPRWLLPAYLHEVMHDYPTPYGEIANFLREHAGQDESVSLLPDYANYPILFYAGDKVRIACQLADDSPLPTQRWRELDAPLDYDGHFPHWLIACGLHPQTTPWLEHFSRPPLEGDKRVQYRYQLVHVSPVYWDQTQRPELHLHSFGPPAIGDNQAAQIYFFRRSP